MRLKIYSVLTIVIVGLTYKNHNRKIEDSIIRNTTLNKCQRTTTYRFVDMDKVNRTLGLNQSFKGNPSSSTCLITFRSQTPDKSLAFNAEITKYSKIRSFRIYLNTKYDSVTNLKNFKAIKSLINDKDFSIKFDQIVNIKFSPKMFFAMNKQVDGGIIQKHKGGQYSITFGDISSYTNDAITYCLGQLLEVKKLQQYKSRLKNISLTSSSVLEVEQKERKPELQLLNILLNKKFSQIKSCQIYTKYTDVILRYNGNEVAGRRKDGTVWHRTP